MTARAGNQAADGERGEILAADTDRDRVAEILAAAYSEGRLSKDEYDARVDAVLSARTYADLGRGLTDLPGPVDVAAPAGSAAVDLASRTNGYAMASLACGLGQFVAGPLATIPAIVFGHLARGQIRRTGEQGAGLALAGLVLGWGAVALAVIVLIGALAALAMMSGTHPMRMP
jgi:hypothetical protein